MKHFVFIAFCFALCLFAAEGCKKHSPPSGGGLGGNATIIARVDHAGLLLDTAIVWIKYGTHNAPANGQYDDSMIVDTNYQAIFRHLTPGSYYLYAEGVHLAFETPFSDGGGPWTIASNNEIDTDNQGVSSQYPPSTPFPPAWWHVIDSE